MDEAAVYAFLAEVFRTVFPGADVDVHAGLTAQDVVGWDSFRQVEIVLALEGKYGVRIRARELAEVANLGDLVALVLCKIGRPR